MKTHRLFLLLLILCRTALGQTTETKPETKPKTNATEQVILSVNTNYTFAPKPPLLADTAAEVLLKQIIERIEYRWPRQYSPLSELRFRFDEEELQTEDFLWNDYINRRGSRLFADGARLGAREFFVENMPLKLWAEEKLEKAGDWLEERFDHAGSWFGKGLKAVWRFIRRTLSGREEYGHPQSPFNVREGVPTEDGRIPRTGLRFDARVIRSNPYVALTLGHNPKDGRRPSAFSARYYISDWRFDNNRAHKAEFIEKLELRNSWSIIGGVQFRGEDEAPVGRYADVPHSRWQAIVGVGKTFRSGGWHVDGSVHPFLSCRFVAERHW